LFLFLKGCYWETRRKLALTEVCAGVIIRKRLNGVTSKNLPENVLELLDVLSFASASEVKKTNQTTTTTTNNNNKQTTTNKQQQQQQQQQPTNQPTTTDKNRKLKLFFVFIYIFRL
jgi:hypothetical protein